MPARNLTLTLAMLMILGAGACGGGDAVGDDQSVVVIHLNIEAGVPELRQIHVAAHLGSGTTLLFANNPLYRGETIGSYALVTNAILGYQATK